MEADERPAKIRKLSHERDTAPPPVPADKDVSVQDAPSDAGTQAVQPAAALPQADADSAIKSQSAPTVAANLSAGIPTSAAATPTAPPSDKSATLPADPLNTEASTASTTQETAPADPPLSKKARKRLLRQQEWDAKRADRKIWRKEKNQAKRERKREQRKEEAENNPDAWKERQRNYVRPTMLPVTFVIDCDFDDKMRDNERVSLAGQITRAYSDNKNSPFRAHMAICSFNGKLRERFDGVLAKNYTHWKGVKFLDEDFVVAGEKAKEWMIEEKRGGKLAGVFAKYAPAQLAVSEEQDVGAETKVEAQTEESKTVTDEANEVTEPKSAETAQPAAKPSSIDPEALAALRAQGETIYLSADSDYTLTELKPFSTYIIGGLVDKNREKGICQARAEAAGIKTARLPIGDYLAMASRKVLATNHVNEIMLKWLECGDWGESFMKVIPKRKGGQLKGNKDENDEGEDEDQDFEEQEEVEAEEENKQEQYSE